LKRFYPDLNESILKIIQVTPHKAPLKKGESGGFLNPPGLNALRFQHISKEEYMHRTQLIGIAAIIMFVGGLCFNHQKGDAMDSQQSHQTILLPSPTLTGNVSVEAALQKRRSVRSYTPEPLSLEDIAQLLWAAQGITSHHGFRTSPSAGALYPLEVYVVSGNIYGLKEGIYRYLPRQHELILIQTGDYRGRLSAAALGQSCVREAPAVMVLTGISSRITGKYGQRGLQYMMMEAGHAAQNVCLQAVTRQIGVVPVGAFKENQVRQILQLDGSELPLYLLPTGKIPSSDVPISNFQR
jgi:SagB-type dehydrogenase family enzyme